MKLFINCDDNNIINVENIFRNQEMWLPQDYDAKSRSSFMHEGFFESFCSDIGLHDSNSS
jgi:hypothetical protein